MWTIVKKQSPQAILVLVLLGLTFGIHVTYSKYRGTGLSRIPVASGHLEAAEGVNDSGRQVAGKRVTYRRQTSTPPYVEDGLQLYPTPWKRACGHRWTSGDTTGRGVSSFSSPVLPCVLNSGSSFTVSRNRA